MSQAQNTNSASVDGLDNLSYLNQSGTAQTLTVRALRAPKASDRRYKIGTIWIETVTNQAFILTSVTSSQAQWGLASAGSSDLDTLTGDTGGPLSPTSGNISILGGMGIDVDGSGSTLTVSTSALASFPITPYVVGAIGEAGFQTVQAAITAATTAGGGVVYIQPGTFTENLTLASNVSLVGTNFNDVTITGIHSLPSSGNILFQNLTLTSTTHILSSAAAGTGTLTFEQCNFTVNNGFVFFLQNWTGDLTISDCRSIGGQDAIVNNSGGATVLLKDSKVGSGGTASSNELDYQGGSFTVDNCIVDCRSTFGASTTLTAKLGSQFNGQVIVTDDCITNFTNVAVTTGSGIAITYDSTGSFTLTEATISSTATTPLSGSGSGPFKLGAATFTDNSDISSSITDLIFSKQTSGTTPYVVGASGIYNTIQDAIDDATVTAPATVLIQAGSFTENLILADDVCLQGVSIDAVTITGQHTPPISGRVMLENINLVSATNIINSAAAGTTEITIRNCANTATNGYLLNVPNWTGPLNLSAVTSPPSGGNNGFVNNTSSSTVTINSSEIGDGSSNPFIVNGILIISDCLITPPSTFTGTLVTSTNSLWGSTVTLAGSARASFTNSLFLVGSVAALTVNTTNTTTISGVTIDSSATPVISGTGSGILEFGTVTFLANSGIASTLTVHRPSTLEAGEIKGRFFDITGDEITFEGSPLGQTANSDGKKPTGGTSDLNILSFGHGIIMEQFVIAGSISMIVPRMDTIGLRTTLDLSSGRGAEYNYGAGRANSKHAFTIGTDNAFFMELELIVADVSGCEPCYIGFRKVEANNVSYTSYTDFSVFGLQDTVNTGTAIIQTRLNSGAVTSTNTTDAWTDGSTHTVRIDIDDAGAVTYLFDGVAPTSTAAFTFDTGDVVVPFIHQIFGATSPGEIHWLSMKVGFLN